MLGLMGFSGSLPLYYLLLLDIMCMFINWANKDAYFTCFDRHTSATKLSKHIPRDLLSVSLSFGVAHAPFACHGCAEKIRSNCFLI